jgi:hypothetical protein
MTARRPNRLGLALPLVLALGLGVAAGGCAVGCPAALLEGRLAEMDGELVLITRADLPAQRVEWPAGDRVERRDGVLAVVDLLGGVKGRVGDEVRLGGGETSAKVFKVCGLFEVEPAAEP